MELENLVTLYAFIEDKKLVFNIKIIFNIKKILAIYWAILNSFWYARVLVSNQSLRSELALWKVTKTYSVNIA